MLTELEKKIIACIQGDIPITERPYLEVARKIGIDEALFIKTLNDLNERGFIRRFGATLKHQKTGFSANAMVAWQVEEDRIEEVGEKMASFSQVTHCYRRDPKEKWPYNLYTMVHASSEENCHETVRQMSEATSVQAFKLLFSRRELKKTSMKFFSNAQDA